MEYNIVEFVDLIREYLYGFFPYENDDQAIKNTQKDHFTLEILPLCGCLLTWVQMEYDYIRYW